MGTKVCLKWIQYQLETDVCHVEMSIIVELWHFQSYNEMPIKNMLLINVTPIQACFVVDCDCHKRMIKMKLSHNLSFVTIKVKSQGHADHICQPCTQNYDTNEAYQSFERKKNCTPQLPLTLWHKVKWKDTFIWTKIWGKLLQKCPILHIFLEHFCCYLRNVPGASDNADICWGDPHHPLCFAAPAQVRLPLLNFLL